MSSTDSNTSTVSPRRMRSPALTTPAMIRWSFTNTPRVLSRSWMYHRPLAKANWACRRDTVGSERTMSLPAPRPMFALEPASRTTRPASLPVTVLTTCVDVISVLLRLVADRASIRRTHRDEHGAWPVSLRAEVDIAVGDILGGTVVEPIAPFATRLPRAQRYLGNLSPGLGQLAAVRFATPARPALAGCAAPAHSALRSASRAGSLWSPQVPGAHAAMSRAVHGPLATSGCTHQAACALDLFVYSSVQVRIYGNEAIVATH